jgi:hypothetical protein
MNLISNVRIFFLRFTFWIRAYIISRYVGVGTADELFGRLYLEATDFGDIFHVNFGRETADRFAYYLNQFTIGLRELITAQLAGNKQGVIDNVNYLYQNASDLAAFLNSVSPSFNETQWKTLLDTYLRHTLEEANSFASGHYKLDIAIFDGLMDLTDTMGYLFAQSLYDYITAGSAVNAPSQGQQCMTLEQMNEIYNIRMIWFDLSFWVRSFMLSKYRGVGDVNDVFNRLQQVPDAFVSSLQQFFGDNPVFKNYQIQLNTYIDLIDSLTTAEMKGNTDEVNRITKLLYQNMDERAASFASLNPSYWNVSDLQTRLYDNLKSTLDESTTFLAGDYARNLDIFDTILDQAESISGVISQGLINYMNARRK